MIKNLEVIIAVMPEWGGGKHDHHDHQGVQGRDIALFDIWEIFEIFKKSLNCENYKL
jgi:hypothetical protein